MPSPSGSKTLFFIAGEPSGDIHTSNLAKEFKRLHPEFYLCGFGGPRMQNVGVEVFFDLTQVAALGLLEVLSQYFLFRRLFHKALQKIKELNPTLIVLTDFPGFNLRFAKEAKKLGFPVIFYISPQVWAWKQRRIYSIPKYVDKMLVIFPFEKNLYAHSSMEVDFVGHPLTQQLKTSAGNSPLREKLNLSKIYPVISLLPGSRKHEIKRILPIMIKTALEIQKHFPSVQFLLCKIPTLPYQLYGKILSMYSLNCHLIEGQSQDALSASDFALVKSGTSTLEATILETPYVLVYKVSIFTFFLGKLLIRIPFLGIANIIAGKMIVPEFIQFQADARKIATYAVSVLREKKRLAEIKEDLRKVRFALESGETSLKAAESISRFIKIRQL